MTKSTMIDDTYMKALLEGLFWWKNYKTTDRDLQKEREFFIKSYSEELKQLLAS